MSLTRAQLTAQVRLVMDATGSTAWTDAELQAWLGLVHWQEYANLLNVINSYQMQTITVTQDANGQFTQASLSTGSGDTAKNFYRILTLAQSATDGPFYTPSKYTAYPIASGTSVLPYIWYPFGRNIQVVPAVSGQTLSCTVNFRPPRVNQLSAESVAVDFPDGYEPILAWRAAALALRKGGNESPAANDLDYQAKLMREEMLLDLGRLSTTPTVMGAFDDRSDWAG